MYEGPEEYPADYNPHEHLVEQIRALAGEHCFSYAFVGVMPGYDTGAACVSVHAFEGDPAICLGMVNRASHLLSLDVSKDVFEEFKQRKEDENNE